jgi:translation initiation factor 2 alpha subunit (eIF-2alpha)
MTNLTEGLLVLCTVKKIEKTTVFIEIDGNGEGSIVLSEIAAGRIRNLRDYVFPNKKIVCKILTIEPDNIQLSLRRVTAKERESILEHNKKEKNILGMLKTVVKEFNETIEKIKEKYDLADFFEEAKESPQILNDFFSKEESEKIYKIISEKIDKVKKVKKIFKLSSNSPSGVKEIKEILDIPQAEIRYFGSSTFSISSEANDFKEANKKLSTILEDIEKKAKQKHLSFSLKEK